MPTDTWLTHGIFANHEIQKIQIILLLNTEAMVPYIQYESTLQQIFDYSQGIVTNFFGLKGH